MNCDFDWSLVNNAAQAGICINTNMRLLRFEFQTFKIQLNFYSFEFQFQTLE